MKAIAFDRFGGPDVLHESEVDVPEPAIPGVEAAGTVDAVGEGVAALAVGDDVFSWTELGAYAEYAVGTRLFPKPAGLSWEAAAALPVAGETSARVLDQLAVGAGDTLLIYSASGAVGSSRPGTTRWPTRSSCAAAHTASSPSRTSRARGSTGSCCPAPEAPTPRSTCPLWPRSTASASGYGDLQLAPATSPVRMPRPLAPVPGYRVNLPPITDWYADCMTKQLAIRLPDQIVREVDSLIAQGRYASRTEAVRVALDRLLYEIKQQQLDAAIVDGYRRVPDAPADAWVEASTRGLVAEEPW